MPTSYPDPYALTILKIPADERHRFTLVKRFRPTEEGDDLEKTDYGCGMFFEVVRMRADTLPAWGSIHRAMMRTPHACYIRGEPVAGLNPQRAQRLLANFADTPRCHIYVDYDTPELPRGVAGAYAARRLMPPAFHDTACFWHRTGSYGVAYRGRTDDPWRSRIRLGFMLDTPLDAPRIKRWLKGHQCDQAIYTANHITYTANPVFEEGAVDPVEAAGEDRFGFLDQAGAMFDAVPVPREIANWVPTHQGTGIFERPGTIHEHKRQELLADAAACDATEGERHGTIARWVFDAYGLGLGDAEIIDIATTTLMRLGRPQKEARPESARLLLGAQRKLVDGTLTVSSHYEPGRDFEKVPNATLGDSSTTPGAPNLALTLTLTTEQATAQTTALIHWWEQLKISPSTGAIKPTLSNASIILSKHSNFQEDGTCILAYDAFQDQPVWTAPPPWWRSRPRNTMPKIKTIGYPLDMDDDAVALSVWLGHLDPASGNEGTPIDVAPKTLIGSITHVARYRTVNPAIAYFDACCEAWDKTPRINRVLEDVCHSTTDPVLLSQWFPKWMMQAVARTYVPGTKCDAVLVFCGAQGAKKSTFFRTICPFAEWFKDDIGDLRDKDSMQNLRGKMILELSEMLGAKRDVDFLKGFITKQCDNFRKAYGHDTVQHPRTVVFCGSTNDDECLIDAGGRRWWVCTIPRADDLTIDIPRVESERAQWWGEAVYRYRAGEEWWLDTVAERATALVALDHSVGLEQAFLVQRWLNTPADSGGPAHPDILLPTEIWTGAMSKTLNTFTSASGRDVARVMSAVPAWRASRFAIRTGSVIRMHKAYIRSGSVMDLDIRARNEYMQCPPCSFTIVK